jgi:hypothetical protein
MRIVAAALAIYAVYLPAAFIAGRNYVPVPRPTGTAVEKINGVGFDHPDHYVVRSYIFRPARFPDVSSISVYENLTPLPRDKIKFVEDAGDYVIRFKTSDGSDPRTDGRHYWIVAR